MVIKQILDIVSKKIKKGRTLAITVNELMESKRLEIAIDNWDNDKLFLKAILVEFGMEVMKSVKNRMISVVGKAYGKGWHDEVSGLVRGKGLQCFELLPVLREMEVDDFNNFNIHWGLSDVEREYYLGLINGTITEENKKVMLERIKKKFLEAK